MEKIRIYADTNILIDFFSGRMNDGMAARIMQLGRTPYYEICTSVLSAVNTIYCRKYFSDTFKPEHIGKVTTLLSIDGSDWEKALKNEMIDFEDCLQVACAIRHGCFAIVTRDHHFEKCPVAVFTPEGLLETLT